MSYETINYLPSGIKLRDILDFAKLLGYVYRGVDTIDKNAKCHFLTFFETNNYRSWRTIELQVGFNNKITEFCVHSRTNVGRSHYDFAMQNKTVIDFKKRFGSSSRRDGGNGEGYDPGPPVPPAASGCYLAVNRFDWNLTRINLYLHFTKNEPQEPHPSTKHLWEFQKELNPDIFSSNLLLVYLISAMEDFFKSTYIALLKYSENKAKILRGSRLSGEQLTQVSVGAIAIEEAIAETLPFQRLSAVGKNFQELDPRLDILAPLKRPFHNRKVSLLENFEQAVVKRHELIHAMNIDVNVNRKEIDRFMRDMTVGIARIYKQINQRYDWDLELPRSSNFSSIR